MDWVLFSIAILAGFCIAAICFFFYYKYAINKEGIGFIKSTFNNTVITLTDKYGNTLSWASGGMLGFSMYPFHLKN